MSYGRSRRSDGRLRITVGDNVLVTDPSATSTSDVFERITLGEIELRPGPALLKAETIDSGENEVLRLNRFFLRRSDGEVSGTDGVPKR